MCERSSSRPDAWRYWAQVLAAALHPTTGHSSVTELDVGGNNLWGADVGGAFADALLAPSCSLVTLDLQGCAIGDAGAAALTAALRAGSRLVIRAAVARILVVRHHVRP